MTMARARIVLAAGLVCATAAAGCGELPTPPKGRDPTRPYRLPADVSFVTAAAIARAPAGGPERTFLTWFRALQTQNFALACRLYDAPVRPSAHQLARRSRLAKGLLGEASLYRVLDVERNGDSATVFTLLVRRLRAPNGQSDLYTLPQAFVLRRVSGRWVLADDLFLRQLARKA